MPAKIAGTSATRNLLMTAPHMPNRGSLVNFSRTLQRLFQLFKREVLAAGDLKDWRLAAAAEFGRIRQLRGDIERNDHGAVTIGVNEIAGAHRHSGHANFAAEIFGVNIGVRRSDRARERLEAGCPLRDVADRTVGNDTE